MYQFTVILPRCTDRFCLQRIVEVNGTRIVVPPSLIELACDSKTSEVTIITRNDPCNEAE